jgi:hypothetical protein
MFVLGFPLLLIPFAIYNMIAFLTPGVSWTAPLSTLHLISGEDWVPTWQDALLAFSLFLLWIEVVKSARMGSRTVMDHILAVALFLVMTAEFLLVARAATSAFFLLTVIALIDVLAGFVVGTRASARQIEVEGKI